MAVISNNQAAYQAQAKSQGYNDLNKYAESLGYTSNSAGNGNANFSAALDGYSKVPKQQPTPLAADYKIPTLQTPKPVNNTQIYDPTKDIESLQASKESSMMQALEAARQRQISNLDNELFKIAPRFDEAINQTATKGMVDQKNYDEFLVNRGLNPAAGATGLQAQSRVNRDIATGSSIGGLQRDKLAAQNEVDFKRADVESQYMSDVASAQAKVHQEALQQLITAKQSMSEQQYQRYKDELAAYYQAAGFDIQAAEMAIKLSDQAYGRQRDTVGDIRYEQEQSISQQQREIENAFKNRQIDEQIRQFEAQMGRQLTQDERAAIQQELENKRYLEEVRRQTLASLGYVNPYGGLTYDREAVAPYNQDYQARINELMKANTADPMIEQLRAAQVEKILANPELMRKYGENYRSLDARKAEGQILGQEISNELSRLQLDFLPQQQQLTIEKARQELELGEIDKAKKEIERANLDETLKAQVLDIFSNIEYRKGQLAIGDAQVAIQEKNAETARITANKENTSRVNQDALDKKRFRLDKRKVDLAEKELNFKISGNNYDVSAPQLAAGIRESFNVVQYDYATGNKVESFDGAAAGRYIDKLGSELDFPPQLLKETRAMVGILPPQKNDPQIAPIKP